MTLKQDPLRAVKHRSLRNSRGRGAYYYESLECGHSISEEPPHDRSLSKPARRRRCRQCRDQESRDGV